MNREQDYDTELVDELKASFAEAVLTTPLSATIRRGRRLRWRRWIGGLGGGSVAAATALAVVLLATGGTSSHGAQLAAWTVTKRPGGVVLVTISQLRDPAGMQRALRADGIPAAVAFQPAHQMSLTPPLPRECHDTGLSDKASAELQEKILDDGIPDSGSFRLPRLPDGHFGMVVAMTIHPAAIPPGIGLNITVNSAPSGWGWSLGLVKASRECTGVGQPHQSSK
ncbi:MAG: hypothetical protein J2P28_10450 [Actinobacteria bacterium]|nr:hypothetical protein [Actinomycetota bacterium]